MNAYAPVYIHQFKLVRGVQAHSNIQNAILMFYIYEEQEKIYTAPLFLTVKICNMCD